MVKLLLKLVLGSTTRGKDRKLGINDQENSFRHFNGDLKEIGVIHPLTCQKCVSLEIVEWVA